MTLLRDRNLLNLSSIADRRAAYLAGTSRSVGRGWSLRPPPTRFPVKSRENPWNQDEVSLAVRFSQFLLYDNLPDRSTRKQHFLPSRPLFSSKREGSPGITHLSHGSKWRVGLSSTYDLHCRTHLSRSMDCPETRPVQGSVLGHVISLPEAGGLHRRYERRKAA